MLGELAPFQAKRHADAAEWQGELLEKLAAFGALEDRARKGGEGEELQLFFSELVWSVVRGDLTPARAVELLSKTALPSREVLQKVFADALWLVGFGALESQPERSVREDFQALCAGLEKEAVLSRPVLALSLETESVPSAVCQVMMLKKKHNQAKTKARYTITRYNLLREHSEGYAKLVVLLERLASLGFEPEASPEQLSLAKTGLVEDVVRLTGFGHLCPNRTLSMALDAYEKKLLEGEAKDPLASPLLGLLQRLPRKRLAEVAVFQLLAHQPPPSSARDARQAQPSPPPSRPSQFLAVASMVAAGYLQLDALWCYLDPADAALKAAQQELTTKYEEDVAGVSKIDLGGSSGKADKNGFGRAFQAMNQAAHQKLRMVAALISVNCWREANRALQHLQRFCKPCLNHHVRSALCDLLKWMIHPLLKPATKRAAKLGPEATYGCLRRFQLGLQLEDSGALRQGTSDLEALLPQIRQVLEHLEYFLHTDLHLLVGLWRALAQHVKAKSTAAAAAGAPFVLDDSLVAVIYRHLLPAASLVPHNPQLSDLMWSVMSQLSVFQRFLIYSCWETMYESFLLKLAYEKTKAAMRQILKRVVSNAERRDLIAHQSHFHVCKLCHSNPIPAIETMLRDVEIGFNVNMIQPYVECTTRCPEMTADVMGFVLTRTCARPISPSRPFLSQADATLSPWLTNLGEFVGRFYKKHPTTDLHGLLTTIARRINNEAVESSADGRGGAPSFQTEYTGESLIRVILEALIEYMGGYVTVADMNAEQLVCLAGGPRLKSESVAVGKKEETSRKEKARQGLFNALVDLGLVPVLWYSLAQQRHHFLSEEFSEAHGGAGGLKLLGLLFDGNHECLLKLIEFLAQACPREKYRTLMPALPEVFTTLEPALAFLAARHGLAPYGSAPPPPPEPEGEAEKAAVVEPTAEESERAAEEERTVAELERVVRSFLPSLEQDTGLSMQFYITFWRLSLQDIFTPTEGYEKAVAQMAASLKQVEIQKKNMERDRDSTHSRDYRTLRKEALRLQDGHAKLKEEQLTQQLNHQKVMARLRREKASWFLLPGPAATSTFVSEMISPRVLSSYGDALFCCHFVRLLIKSKTPGFHLLDFYNCWTVMLTQCIRSCSEREARIFGVFLREMMSYITQLRKDENSYLAEMKDNPCFHRAYYDRRYYEDTAQTQKGDKVAVEWLQFGDIKKGHSKWEGRIYKAMRQGLEAEDWMEKRNALLLLSQCYESFPVVEKYARAILTSVENLRDREELSDLKTLANSLMTKLRSQKEHWVDKGPAEPARGEHRREEPGRGGRAKNPLAQPGGGGGVEAAPKARDRSREKEGATERRSRREDEEREKESREHKESRQTEKEKAKEKLAAKESRDSAKEAQRAAEKEQKRLERPREKEALGAPRESKRSSATAAAPVSSSAHAEERAEKRRRLEREELAALGGSSRGGGDRGDSRHGYGASGERAARNALTSAPEPPRSSHGDGYSRSGYVGGGHTSSSHGSRYEAHRSRRHQ